MYEFRLFRASLTLTLSQRERESILLSSFPRAYVLGYTHAAPLALKSSTANWKIVTVFPYSRQLA